MLHENFRSSKVVIGKFCEFQTLLSQTLSVAAKSLRKNLDSVVFSQFWGFHFSYNIFWNQKESQKMETNGDGRMIESVDDCSGKFSFSIFIFSRLFYFIEEKPTLVVVFYIFLKSQRTV